MRKIQTIALGAVISVGAIFTSCEGGATSGASASASDLKTDSDSLAYAYGAGFYQEALERELITNGILGDTLSLVMSYSSQISAEQDATKKQALEKELAQKKDSISVANKKNKAAFLKGLQEGLSDSKGEKSAYAMGLNTGGNISKNMFPGIVGQLYGPEAKVEEKMKTSLFLAGVTAAANGQKLALENPLEVVENTMKAAQEKSMLTQFGENKTAGEKFLAENKAKDGIVTLPSGVQYKIVKEGKGEKPAAADQVKVSYHGTLIDGTVFDSSVDRKEPVVFGVGQVIPGWTEVLQLMPVGSKWQVYIPQDKAYGAGGQGAIKPFSALIFDVELLSIEK